MSGQDKGVQFLAEAKKHLDLEMGRTSITAIQGLWTLFTVTTINGTDNAGRIYRLASYDMMSRMRFEEAFAVLGGDDDDSSQLRARRAISKVVWGIFCLD